MRDYRYVPLHLDLWNHTLNSKDLHLVEFPVNALRLTTGIEYTQMLKRFNCQFFANGYCDLKDRFAKSN
jgi:hypothetical protein